MATTVMMKHPETRLVKKGVFGFSWTTFLCGGFPALFRGDVLTGLIVIALNILTFGIAGIIWAFFYNKSYTTKLIEKGYKFADSEAICSMAKASIGVTV